MQILFILVLYYNDDEVECFFRDQLKKQTLQDFHVLIVNNGCRDIGRLRSRFSDAQNVEIIGEGENLGYMGGANFAISYFKNKYTNKSPLVIISNTDIEFLQIDFLEKLFCEKDNFDVAGPSILSTITHSELNPFSIRRISRSKLNFLNFVYSAYYFYLMYQSLSLIKRKFFKTASNDETGLTPVNVYAIHGSFMVLASSYFEKGGDFNYGSFLYEEEVFIAEKARLADLRTMYIPSLRLLHREHATTGTFKSRKQIEYMRNSIRYILDTFYHD